VVVRQALGALAELGRDSLGRYAPGLVKLLLGEAGGRLWEGKEVVLVALGQLCKACPDAVKADPGASKVWLPPFAWCCALLGHGVGPCAAPWWPLRAAVWRHAVAPAAICALA
jgi:hypothetical protein